jgi:hypothetical protein
VPILGAYPGLVAEIHQLQGSITMTTAADGNGTAIFRITTAEEQILRFDIPMRH